MDALVVTHRGFEDIAAKEINELVKASSVVCNGDGTVSFSVKSLKDLCLLAYKSQSAIRVLRLFGKFVVNKDLESTVAAIKGLIGDNRKEIISYLNDSFTISCSRSGEHSFTSQDLMLAINVLIDRKRIDFKSPQSVFYIHIVNDAGYFGFDLAGFDLSRRDYKIYNPSRSIKGAMAYCLVRLSGYDKKKAFLDPFTYSGVFPIEAALFAANKSPNFYRRDKLLFNNVVKFDFDAADKESKSVKKIFALSDSMNSLRAAKNNAKIAGINKLVSFSRMDAEWLDTKFTKASIDCIASKPPFISKNSDASAIRKIYTEFFHQAEFILKKKGMVVVLSNSDEPLVGIASKNSFSLKERRDAFLGEVPVVVLVFVKS